MTASLLVYALSPFQALRLPWRYLSSITLFPVYASWKFLISLGRPAQTVGSHRARTAT